MKKVISYLITIMMVFTMMPYVAFADNVNDKPAEEGESLALYVEQENELFTEGDSEPLVEVIDVEPLSDDEVPAPNGSTEIQYAETVEEAAANLRAAMVERQTNAEVNIKVDELTEEALTATADQIFKEAIKHTGNPKEGDSLKWVWENCGVSISGTSDGTNCYAAITYDITYYTTAEQEAALTSAVESLKEELNLDGKTDYEKVKAIYDYMVANISYDYTNLENDSHKLKYTAYAALINKTSVCQGYATLFYRLALEYGIDTRVIGGTSVNNNDETEAHSWNIVKLNDKYYNLDATWDSTWNSDKATHDFFLRGSNAFTNHTSDNEFLTEEFSELYPISKTSYVVESEDEGSSDMSKLWTDYAAKSFAGGDGTVENPYQIETAEQLALLAKLSNENNYEYRAANYILMKDINLDAHEWVPIATQNAEQMHVNKGFEGTFDGNSYTISNMKLLNVKEYSFYGLFGEINGGAVINLNIESPEISLKGTADEWGEQYIVYIGTICGISNIYFLNGEPSYRPCNFSNIKIDNFNIDIDAGGNNISLGSVIGSASVSHINNVHSKGSISYDNAEYTQIGGLAGYLAGNKLDDTKYIDSEMESCSFNGQINTGQDLGRLSLGGMVRKQ